MRKFLPLLLALVGLGAGLGAGLFLRPSDTGEEATAPPTPLAPAEYVKLSNQFVVPVVERGEISSLVILSLSLEIDPGASEAVYAREPRLRDAFLQVLFQHANSGGFHGAFTADMPMTALRTALRETAQKIVGPQVRDTLIIDLVRQDS